MGDDPIVISSGPVLTPESVMSRRFSAAFRGYHPTEVRQFLQRVSAELTAGASREAELRRALDEVQKRAHPHLDEDIRTLGDAGADAVLDAARAEGREMVAQARDLRERMLGDLARRRRAAQVQVEQLRATHHRLQAAYDVVRRTLDEATAELAVAGPEPRMAAEAAGRDSQDPTPLRGDGARSAPEAQIHPAAPPERPSALVTDPPGPPLRQPPPFDHAAASNGSTASAPWTVGLSEEPRPRQPRPADRPPMRPQTVADVAPGRRAPSPSPDVAPPSFPVGPSATGDPPERPASPALDPVVAEQALVGRDDLLETIEAGLTRALKRVLQDEQNAVLDGLRRLGASDAVLPAPAAHLAAYRDASVPWLRQAARAGVGHASESGPGPGADAAHPPIEPQAASLVAELVGPLRERLLRAVADTAGSEDPAVVGESIRAVYRQWRTQRMEDAARHYAVAAFALGAFAATPTDLALQWLVDDDGHCPDCDDNALAGPTPKGQTFPTGQLHPPAHQGCRCLLVPATA